MTHGLVAGGLVLAAAVVPFRVGWQVLEVRSGEGAAPYTVLLTTRSVIDEARLGDAERAQWRDLRRRIESDWDDAPAGDRARLALEVDRVAGEAAFPIQDAFFLLPDASRVHVRSLTYLDGSRLWSVEDGVSGESLEAGAWLRRRGDGDELRGLVRRLVEGSAEESEALRKELRRFADRSSCTVVMIEAAGARQFVICDEERAPAELAIAWARLSEGVRARFAEVLPLAAAAGEPEVLGLRPARRFGVMLLRPPVPLDALPVRPLVHPEVEVVESGTPVGLELPPDELVERYTGAPASALASPPTTFEAALEERR